MGYSNLSIVILPRDNQPLETRVQIERGKHPVIESYINVLAAFETASLEYDLILGFNPLSANEKSTIFASREDFLKANPKGIASGFRFIDPYSNSIFYLTISNIGSNFAFNLSYYGKNQELDDSFCIYPSPEKASAWQQLALNFEREKEVRKNLVLAVIRGTIANCGPYG